MLGLMNARVKRVEGPDLHVNRSRSHELEKERRIPQNPLIKGWIMREFDMSDGVKEGGEDGVDGILQILFVEFVDVVIHSAETRDDPIHLIQSHRDGVEIVLRTNTSREFNNRSARKTPHVVEETRSKGPKSRESSVEGFDLVINGLFSCQQVKFDV